MHLDSYPEQSQLGHILLQMGLFAFSGAVTNSLAIHMLFERVPGLYGSGVIPSRFKEFRAGIKALIMEQFFSKANLSRLVDSEKSILENIQVEPILEVIDYDAMFVRMKEAVDDSPLGQMLAMFGGTNALDPLKPHFQEKMRQAVGDTLNQPGFIKAVSQQIGGEQNIETLQQQVQTIVEKRLSELTPDTVKHIIQKMIREHLGWLVVWGGVFGGLIGLLAALATLS